jgi:GNAT superfamily N-acetyltransferase
MPRTPAPTSHHADSRGTRTARGSTGKPPARAAGNGKRTAEADSRPAVKKRVAAAAPASRRNTTVVKRADIPATPPKSRAAKKPHHELVPTPPSADAPHWTETLADGTRVIVRPIHKEDAELERAFIKRLSPESRRLRFLGQVSEPSDDLIKRLTDIDYQHDAAFVALVHRAGEKREIGVSRYSTSTDGRSCECAVAVDDEWHKKGLGTLLMRHLIELARSRGLRTMVSIDAANNLEMRDLAKFLGFRRRIDPADPTQVIHTLTL